MAAKQCAKSAGPAGLKGMAKVAVDNLPTSASPMKVHKGAWLFGAMQMYV